MLAKNYRLAAKAAIEEVKKKGKTVRSKNFTVLSLDRGDKKESKIAFIVSKKVSPLAVTRNKVKRILAESARQQTAYLKVGFNIVIIASPGSNRAYTDELLREMRVALTKAKIIK